MNTNVKIENRITKDMFVREVADRWPQTVSVAGNRKLDFCCGGAHSIEQTAKARGCSDVDALVENLNRAIWCKSYCTLVRGCYSACESFLKLVAEGRSNVGRNTVAYFITDTCIGCTVCELKCPVDTISGKPKELYVIHPEGCIDCGVCAIYCPVSCIQDQYGNLVQRIKPSQIPKAKVIVDDCTGCEFCVDICPFDCIYMKEDPTHTGAGHYKVAEVIPEECVACRLCEIVCDKDAIIVPNAPTHRAAMLPHQLEKH